MIKGTVSVISSNLPFKEKHSRFTTVPFKPLTDQGCRIYPYQSNKRFVIVNHFVLRNIKSEFLKKTENLNLLFHIWSAVCTQRTIARLEELTSGFRYVLLTERSFYLMNSQSFFKGSVGNWTLHSLHGGSLTLTVHLKI